jgi:hypothetical protein
MTVRQWINKIGAVLVLAMVANAAYQWLFNSKAHNPAAAPPLASTGNTTQAPAQPATFPAAQAAAQQASFPEDRQGLRLLESPQLYGTICEKLKDAVVFDRVKGSASANNHPAYVLGYRFGCVSNFGSEPISIYIGWIENQNTNKLECIHHNKDKERVVSEGWHFCGGNFRQL